MIFKIDKFPSIQFGNVFEVQHWADDFWTKVESFLPILSLEEAELLSKNK